MGDAAVFLLSEMSKAITGEVPMSTAALTL